MGFNAVIPVDQATDIYVLLNQVSNGEKVDTENYNMAYLLELLKRAILEAQYD